MTFPTPDQFFIENGGRALLDAHGIQGDTLKSYFSRRLPTISTPDKPAKPGATSTPMVTACPATLLISKNHLEVYAYTHPGKPVPGVSIERAIPMASLGSLLLRALDMPRPLMVLTVGASYAPSLANAQFSLDPDSVVVSGHTNLVLDRDRVKRIAQGQKRYSVPDKDTKPSASNPAPRKPMPVRDFMKLVAVYEKATAESDVIPESAIVAATRLLKAADHPTGVEDLRKFWANMDQMPLLSDYAWKVAIAAEKAATSEDDVLAEAA